MKKHLLSALLLLWVLAVAGIGLQRLLALGATLDGNGPLALASDRKGTLWLATRDELFRLDAYERVEARWTASRLGLREINSLATSRDGALWIFDSALRRPFRCTRDDMQCAAFGPATLDLDHNVRMTENAAGELLLADNNRHRVLRLGADGELLDSGASHRRAFPNHIHYQGDKVLLADTDHRRILALPDDADAAGDIALSTQQRPYRFVARGNEWWVIEAGVALEQGRLRHYRDGKESTLPLDADDPYDIADNGQRLFVSSLTDWQLLSLDPATGASRAVSDPQLQAEFGAQRLAVAEARRQRHQIPLFMIAFMLPALGGGLLLQRRIDRDNKVAGDNHPVTTERHRAETMNARHGMGLLRIVPDGSPLKSRFAEQNRILLRIALLTVPLLLLMTLAFWVLLGDKASTLLPLLLLTLAMPLLLGLVIYLHRRQQRRLLNQHLVCGPQKLVHVIAGKPRLATAYEDIWLGDGVLVMGSLLLPLHHGHGLHRLRLWPLSDIQREIGMRIPPAQSFDSDLALGRALLRHRPLLGLRLISTRFAVAIAIGLVLLLKLAEIISNFGMLKLLNLANLF